MSWIFLEYILSRCLFLRYINFYLWFFYFFVRSSKFNEYLIPYSRKIYLCFFLKKSSINITKYIVLFKDLSWNHLATLEWINRGNLDVFEVLILNIIYQLCLSMNHVEHLKSVIEIFNKLFITINLIWYIL